MSTLELNAKVRTEIARTMKFHTFDLHCSFALRGDGGGGGETGERERVTGTHGSAWGPMGPTGIYEAPWRGPGACGTMGI